MPRIKNTLVYPFKPNPKLTDWLVGSDSEDFGETLSFRVGDISGSVLGGGLPNGIISGSFGLVKGTMTLNISRIVYRIGGILYTTDPVSITLDQGGLENRIDVIAVNVDQEVVIIKGEESNPAVKPVLPDTSTHLEFTQINVDAGATEPSDVEVNVIFDEEDPSEYTESNNTSDSSMSVVSNLPFLGNKAIKIESPSPGDRLTLSSDTLVEIDNRNFLQFYAYLILNLIYPKGVKISFYNGVDKVSTDVTVRDGVFGMDGDLMTAYQLITIPFTEFVFTDTHYDSIVIEPTDEFGVGIMYIDYVTISSGFAGVDTTINHSEIYLDDGTNPHGTTQEDVGLGNVDNTSDTDKPISIAQQVEFDNRYTKTEINNFFGGVVSITGYNKTDWDEAYSWGDHSLEGYLTNQDLQFDVVTPIDSYFGTKYKPLGVASSGIYIDGSSNKSNGVLINVPNNVGIDTCGAFSLVQDNVGYETGGDFILYPNNYRYAQYRNNLGVYFTSKLFITGSRNTSEITFELGNVAQAYNNPSNLDTILKMASNREITAPQLTNARITSGGDFSLVTKKYLEDNSSTFTPTDLLTDYGFTDNSTNWNTAFGWGNHAVAGYELQSNKGAANGYASLDANSKLLTSQLPDLAVTSVITVTETNLADFAANSSSYSFEEGDVIVITDAGETEHYMYKGGTKTDVNEYSLINNTEIDWGQVTNTPTTLSGYGITDFNSLGDARWLRKDVADTASGVITFSAIPRLQNNGSFPGINFNNGTNNRFLFRSGDSLLFQYNGTDNGTIWHSFNDGAGSGLDADLLDGVDSSQFLRSDVADTKTSGELKFNNNVTISLGTSARSTIFSDGSSSYFNLLGGNFYIQDVGTNRFTFNRTTGDFTATGSINSTKAFINGGTGANLNIASNPNGTIEFGNNSAGTLPSIAGKSNNNSGLYLIGATNDSNTNGDLIFNVRENDNTDFTTLTSKGFVWSRFGTEIANLTRNGNFTIIGTIVSQGVGTSSFAGDVTATNFILSSDIKLKTNIQEVSSEEYVNVNWKTFELKENKGQKRYGVIAQELEETNPEFVRTNDEGVKSVAYIDLLIAKIAELEARLEKAGL